MFQIQILQRAAHLVILSEKQDTLIQPKREQDTQVYTYSHRRGAFLHAHDSQLAATRPLRYLRDTQIPAQTRHADLFTYYL
jgi:hypothetical protein